MSTSKNSDTNDDPVTKGIPLLVRRGGRDIKKMSRSLPFNGADGVVAHTET
jgi:hypothetical protein